MRDSASVAWQDDITMRYGKVHNLRDVKKTDRHVMPGPTTRQNCLVASGGVNWASASLTQRTEPKKGEKVTGGKNENRYARKKR